MNMILIYAVFMCQPNFQTRNMDCTPGLKLFDSPQSACTFAASKSIFTSTIFEIKIKPTEDCDDKNGYRFQECLDWITQPPYSVSKMNCVPTPNYTIEAGK